MRFHAGDIIKVYAAEGDQYIGQALETRGISGLAFFSILRGESGVVMEFNLNYDQVEVVYPVSALKEFERKYA